MNSRRGASPEAPSGCRRCGTCCQKGGPAFHLADRELIESGRIPARLLFTIRAGEPVRDNVADRIQIADSDIIKLRGTDGTPACVCHDPVAGCTIYADRPVECRALDCRDTASIAELYRRDRLTRKDLFQPISDLWRLIRDHQGNCGYESVGEIVGMLGGPDAETARLRLGEILEMDRLVRREPVRRGLVPAGWTDLLFGRPLSRTLSGFGLRVTETGRGFQIRPASSLPFRDPSFMQGDLPCSTCTNS